MGNFKKRYSNPGRVLFHMTKGERGNSLFSIFIITASLLLALSLIFRGTFTEIHYSLLDFLPNNLSAVLFLLFSATAIVWGTVYASLMFYCSLRLRMLGVVEWDEAVAALKWFINNNQFSKAQDVRHWWIGFHKSALPENKDLNGIKKRAALCEKQYIQPAIGHFGDNGEWYDIGVLSITIAWCLVVWWFNLGVAGIIVSAILAVILFFLAVLLFGDSVCFLAACLCVLSIMVSFDQRYHIVGEMVACWAEYTYDPVEETVTDITGYYDSNLSAHRVFSSSDSVVWSFDGGYMATLSMGKTSVLRIRKNIPETSDPRLWNPEGHDINLVYVIDTTGISLECPNCFHRKFYDSTRAPAEKYVLYGGSKKDDVVASGVIPSLLLGVGL